MTTNQGTPQSTALVPVFDDNEIIKILRLDEESMTEPQLRAVSATRDGFRESEARPVGDFLSTPERPYILHCHGVYIHPATIGAKVDEKTGEMTDEQEMYRIVFKVSDEQGRDFFVGSMSKGVFGWARRSLLGSTRNKVVTEDVNDDGKIVKEWFAMFGPSIPFQFYEIKTGKGFRYYSGRVLPQQWDVA